MKLRKLNLISLLTVISTITVSSCTSAEDNPCGTGYETGIINGNPYIFWMDADYGQLIVEVKDAKGNTESSYQNTIDQYYRNTNGPVQDCSTQTQQNNAVYYLSSGKKYTYTAYNNRNKFTGTIDLTCQESACTYIKISSENL